MAWRVEYLAAEHVVAVISIGEISNEDIREQVAETIRVLKQNEATLVLADYSEALSEASLASLYLLPDDFTRTGAPWNARVAVVTPHTRYRIETYQFFELVCKNAGYNVSLFDEREAAEVWLRQTWPVPTAAAPASELHACGVKS
jgi:hypothetical protein